MSFELNVKENISDLSIENEIRFGAKGESFVISSPLPIGTQFRIDDEDFYHDLIPLTVYDMTVKKTFTIKFPPLLITGSNWNVSVVTFDKIAIDFFTNSRIVQAASMSRPFKLNMIMQTGDNDRAIFPGFQGAEEIDIFEIDFVSQSNRLDRWSSLGNEDDTEGMVLGYTTTGHSGFEPSHLHIEKLTYLPLEALRINRTSNEQYVCSIIWA